MKLGEVYMEIGSGGEEIGVCREKKMRSNENELPKKEKEDGMGY